ncbi:MAG: Single-stranded-DNA-specific exonuclease RecJ [Tenericutes bacterium ADurb.Bin239]|nr:MAG: Single-stranded-DNA-specific exonuclease RecJ [Tenericutes bacterium ADurb.Bin239]
MSAFLEKLLKYYDLTYAEYEKLCAKVSKDDLPAASAFFNFTTFINRLETAISNDEQIVVYGDYDADGILATSIVKYAFAKRNKDVFTMIPSRYRDGYGLNTSVVEKFAKRGITLIVTVDNGISQHHAIDYANSLGIDVLVSDHHEIGDELPKAKAILHPELSTLPKVNSCGAYMALLISYGLLGYYDDYLISLAGIATLADMMPLVDRNRTLVKLAIEVINEYQYFPLIKLNDSTFIDETSLSMRIAPKINALGRLSQNYEANVLVEYFTTSDVKRHYEIANYIEKVYLERKKMSKAETLSDEEVKNPALVLISDELEGVLGLIAQNYVLEYNKPAFIFTESSEDPALLKGSVRSRAGFNVVDAFTYLQDYIIASGGHPEAGGLTIRKADFKAFAKEVQEYAKQHPLVKVPEKYLEVTIDEITPENFEMINRLSPFGHKFKTPLLFVSPLHFIKYAYSRDGQHVITLLPSGIKLIAFYMADESKNPLNIGFTAIFVQSEFRGRKTIELRIKEFLTE